MMQKADTTSNASSDKKVVTRVCASKQFPGKLHNLLSYAESHGLDWVIGWCHDGKAFIVRSQEHLLQILPIFFGQTKFRSFQRQLNMWHFERVLIGPFKGAFMHPCFVRGNKALCASMSRHHLPSAELYSQAWLGDAAGDKTSSQQPNKLKQIVLDNKPNQLTLDRHSVAESSLSLEDPKQQLQNEPSTRKIPSNSTIETTNKECNMHGMNRVKKRERSATLPRSFNKMMTDHTRAIFAERDNDSIDRESASGAASSRDQDEDWSLLSDCLQCVINPETFTSSSPWISHDGVQEQTQFPVDALAPGMEEPASPETIENLFLEFSA